MKSKITPRSYLNRIIWAFRELWYGLITFRYPVCCVLQFISETLKDEKSCKKRQKTHKKYNPRNYQYVPCDKCLKGKEL